jgi:glyoxylase-like metal-dependent hydrolase (beta-lactamase superfamily II)
MQIKALYHESTGTLTYIVWDEQSRDAVIIDSVLDFDPGRVSISTEALQELYTEVESRQLCVQAVLDTHAHADHLSGMAEIKTRYGCSSIVGSGIRRVQETFSPIFGMGPNFPTDGSQFDHLLDDGQSLQLGSLTLRALHTPGHTPSCTCFLIGDAVFTGDALFMPDFGTGRCDFPNGSAEALYDSVVGKLYALPPETRVFVGHDYRPGQRALCYQSTIGECATTNKQLCADTLREEFVRWRTERDAGLNLPQLLFQAIQVNINAGQLPASNSDGIRHLRLPIGQFDRVDV